MSDPWEEPVSPARLFLWFLALLVLAPIVGAWLGAAS